MTWKRVAIDSIAKTVTKGTTPTSIGYEFSPRGIPFLRVNNIQGGDLNIDDILFIDSGTDEALKRSRIRPKDVLLSIAGTIGKTAVVPDDAPPMNCNQAVAIIRLKENALPKYLGYWLNTNDAFRQISGSKVTGTISNLSLGCIKDLEIPLPPLEEQRRIAAILDKADGVRRKRKEAIALTEELLRSTFLEMFGDPVTNPKGWEIWSVRDVIQNISTGWSAGGEDKPLDEGEWGVLKISAVTTGQFISTEYKNVGKPPFKNPTIVPKKGDLLFTRANTRELVAATCLVEKDCKNVFLPDKIWSIKTIEEISTHEYLRFLLAEPKYRSLITKKATGTSGSMLNVSQKKLLEMNAPIPPIDLQRKFSNLVWKSVSLRRKYELATEHSESEFNALLQQAFRGEL